jgi:hypothetical protein
MSADKANAPRLEKSCPIPKAHTRLRHVHDQWHRAARDYQDPDAFCLSLNSAIQTIRTVTFVLQAEKRAISDFDSWYAAWQERMRSDPLMDWLKHARNQVEKQGDLETKSTARVAVLADWSGPRTDEFDVPPLLSADEIADYLSQRVPDELRQTGVLTVERRWVADNLPDHELLDVLAHGYGFLAELLADAHLRCGVRMQTFGAEAHDGRHGRSVQAGGPLPCMAANAESRTARIHLGRDEPFWIERRETTLTRKEIQAFKPSFEVPGEVMAGAPDDDLLEKAARFAEFAKLVLVNEGHHDSMAMIFPEDASQAQLRRLHISDDQEKLVAVEAVAQEVEQLHATGVVLVGEAWTTQEDDAAAVTGSPSARPTGREALVLVAATPDGRCRIWETPFQRTGKSISLGTTAIRDGERPAFLAPIFRAWARSSTHP